MPESAPELEAGPMTATEAGVAGLRRGHRDLRPGARARGARRARHRHQDVLRLPPPSSAPSRTPRSARSAWHCPARCRRSTATAVEYAIRIGLALNCSDRPVVPVRPEELLLPGHAQELPDLAVRRADRVQRLAGRGRRRRNGAGRDRTRAHGGGHRQVAARRRRHRTDPRRRVLAARLQPGRRAAGRDRHQTHRGDEGLGAGGGPRLRGGAARPAAGRWASRTSGWIRDRCAATRTSR